MQRPEGRAARRRRRSAASSEPLTKYLAKATGFLVAVAVLGYLLLQLAQVGKQSEPPPLIAPAPAVVSPAGPAPGGPDSQPQPAAQPATKPGQGELRMTSRILEPSYTVQSGDTLGIIAARFGTSVEALQSINNLPDRNVLSVGQKLVIPNQP